MFCGRSLSETRCLSLCGAICLKILKATLAWPGLPPPPSSTALVSTKDAAINAVPPFPRGPESHPPRPVTPSGCVL